MHSNPQIVLAPIGFVRNDHPPGRKPRTWQGIISQIEIESHWTEGLEGLEGFSHVTVLCYLHLMQDETPVLRIHPQRNRGLPQVGFFGTRTPLRPNPISMTSVSLVKREKNILHVRNLDMFDGTPVLDVKPYLTRGDCHPQATGPEWIYRLWALHDEQRSGHDRPISA